MEDKESMTELERQFEDKSFRLKQFKKVIPKIFLIILPLPFVMPFIPHRRIISLVEEQGYWGSVLFGALIYLIVIPIALYLQYLNRLDEIQNLEKEIRIKKVNRK